MIFKPEDFAGLFDDHCRGELIEARAAAIANRLLDVRAVEIRVLKRDVENLRAERERLERESEILVRIFNGEGASGSN